MIFQNIPRFSCFAPFNVGGLFVVHLLGVGGHLMLSPRVRIFFFFIYL
jgi:hypothetical protein